MELWSAFSYQSQDYSSATHVRVGSSQVSQRDVLVNAGVGGLIASAESPGSGTIGNVNVLVPNLIPS